MCLHQRRTQCIYVANVIGLFYTLEESPLLPVMTEKSIFHKCQEMGLQRDLKIMPWIIYTSLYETLCKIGSDCMCGYLLVIPDLIIQFFIPALRKKREKKPQKKNKTCHLLSSQEHACILTATLTSFPPSLCSYAYLQSYLLQQEIKTQLIVS